MRFRTFAIHVSDGVSLDTKTFTAKVVHYRDLLACGTGVRHIFTMVTQTVNHMDSGLWHTKSPISVQLIISSSQVKLATAAG